MRNDQRAMESKQQDKVKAKQDGTFRVTCFDLEEVHLTPKGFPAPFCFRCRVKYLQYYNTQSRKFDGHSYIWNESIAGTGSCEIDKYR